MFGIFKRTKIARWETDLLLHVIKKLPSDYSSLIDQINDGLFRGVIVNASDIPGYVAFTYNHSILIKHEREKERDYKLTNIQVYNRITHAYEIYTIYISNGVISGYSIGGLGKYDFDLNKIVTSALKKEFVVESDYNRIIHLLNDEEKGILNPSEVYSIIIDNKEYFHLKDLDDGDFIGMDERKVIFKVTHDPLEIVAINQKFADVIKGK